MSIVIGGFVLALLSAKEAIRAVEDYYMRGDDA